VPARSNFRALCRLQIGDTADYKSALRETQTHGARAPQRGVSTLRLRVKFPGKWLDKDRRHGLEISESGTAQTSFTAFFGLSASATMPQRRTNTAAPIAIRSGQLIVREFEG
jgi:hypothetical protein